jgi:quercetin dioxygenase-like cupin family protein
MTKGWGTAKLDEIEAMPGPGTLRWTPVRRHFDVRAFGVNAYTAAEAGQDVVEEHTESALGHQELYVVVAGRARFTLDGEEVDAPSGTLVYLRDPEVRRAAVAEEPGTTVVALGGKPGEPYEVSPWEFWFAATPKGQAGDYAGAIAELDAGFEHHPEHPMLHYQRACWEALGGQREAALADLRRAVELGGERYREFARTDADFDSLRSEPEFPA